MANTSIFLMIILFLGFLAQSRVVVLASLVLLLFLELNIEPFLHFVSKWGIEIGLIFLLLSILSSMVLTPLKWEQIRLTFVSKEGIIAIIAGILATRFNGMGLKLLNIHPQIIVGIIVGSMIGIAFLGGIPVGPLMAAGITAVILEIIGSIM